MFSHYENITELCAKIPQIMSRGKFYHKIEDIVEEIINYFCKYITKLYSTHPYRTEQILFTGLF